MPRLNGLTKEGDGRYVMLQCNSLSRFELTQAKGSDNSDPSSCLLRILIHCTFSLSLRQFSALMALGLIVHVLFFILLTVDDWYSM